MTRLPIPGPPASGGDPGPTDPVGGVPERSADRPGNLLYIAGYGRSGSTLLDIALSAHHDIEGFGELAYLFDELARDQARSDFWDRFPPGPHGHEHDDLDQAYRRAADLIDRSERLVAGPGLLWSARRRDHRALHRVVLGELWRRSEALVVIDSSKSSWLRTWRLPLLAPLASRTHCLVLVRDLGGVVHSLRSGRGDTRTPHRLPTTRAVIGWAVATVSAVATGLAACGRTRTAVVRYEDLANQPGPTLAAIVDWLGLAPDPGIDRGLTEGFRPGHQVHGNRVKTQDRIRIDPRSGASPPVTGGAGLAVRAVTTVVERLILRWAPGLPPARPAHPPGEMGPELDRAGAVNRPR